MSSEESNKQFTSVPKEVLDQFLQKLKENEVTSDIITRLKTTLVDNGDFSETAIKTALFANDNTSL